MSLDYTERTDAPMATTRTQSAPKLAADLMQRVHTGIQRARRALLGKQESDGHWCYPLEADCTIPAEYVLMRHFIGDVDRDLEGRIAKYLRRHQAEHGGWPLYEGGAFDISCSVKAYWALKIVGDDIDAPHMQRARNAILERGGAARCNVFTRIALALFGLIPWRAVPWLPVEIVLLPRLGPFHLTKVSYWSRAVMVPLAILCTLKARAQNPTGHDLNELFVVPPDEERNWFSVRSARNRVYLTCERTLRHCDRWIPGFVRRRAFERALNWTLERLNGEDGLGGIFPAMVNAHEVFVVLGRPEHEEHRAITRRALDRLLIHEGDETWCQPCFSPIWDTALASLALQEAAEEETQESTDEALQRAHVWLLSRQVMSGPADWRWNRPKLAPGGWAFQYANPYFPDLDDTSIVAWALWRADRDRFEKPVERATNWFIGMQSRSGGFASFDADNTFSHLNHIPFADHGALLDPPSSDVTARCLARARPIAPPRGSRSAPARVGVLGLGARRRRFVVWPLGYELHLRHVVGPLGLGTRPGRRLRAAHRASGGMAALDATTGRQLGRDER